MKFNEISKFLKIRTSSSELSSELSGGRSGFADRSNDMPPSSEYSLPDSDSLADELSLAESPDSIPFCTCDGRGEA